MDRSALKSDYCVSGAIRKFGDLIEKLNAKYIVVSYNNTGDSMNDRSNARLTDDEILACLRKRGSTRVYEQKFSAFTAGKSSARCHSERLFVCESR